jgi:glycosyltransferase A (GT-A) superfamily protein (DUF2064 family)
LFSSFEQKDFKCMEDAMVWATKEERGCVLLAMDCPALGGNFVQLTGT